MSSRMMVMMEWRLFEGGVKVIVQWKLHIVMEMWGC
jgi:hypothetical protein